MLNQDGTGKDKERMDDASHLHFIEANLSNISTTDQPFLLDAIPMPSSGVASTIANNATTASSDSNVGVATSTPISHVQIGTPWLTNTTPAAASGVLKTTPSQAPAVSHLIHQHQFQPMNPTNFNVNVVKPASQPPAIGCNQPQQQLNIFNAPAIFQTNQQAQAVGPVAPSNHNQPQTAKSISCATDPLRQAQMQVQPQQQHAQPAASIFTVQPQQLLPATLINPQFQPLPNSLIPIPNVGTHTHPQALPSTIAYVSLSHQTNAPAPISVNTHTNTNINVSANANIKPVQINKRKLNAIATANAPTVVSAATNTTATGASKKQAISPPEEENTNSKASSTSSFFSDLSGLTSGAGVGTGMNFGAIHHPHVASRSQVNTNTNTTTNTAANSNLANSQQTKRARQKSPATTRKDATSTVVTANSVPNKKVEDMTPEERRRHERNTREQQRSHKISQQIKELRNVLTESKVPFKQNKYSILMSVVDYIKQLQQRAGLLDNEHNKLVTTIQQTNEMVKSGITDQSDMNLGVGNDVELLCARGLDYKTIFEQCSIPLGVAALDGRLLACNPKFEEWTGLSKQALESRTLFGLLSANIVDEVFRALGTMLKSKSSGQEQEKEDTQTQEQVHGQLDPSRNNTGSCIVGSEAKLSDGNRSDGSGDGSGTGSGSGSGTSDYKVSDATTGGSSRDSDEENITNSCNVGYWSGALPSPREDVSTSL